MEIRLSNVGDEEAYSTYIIKTIGPHLARCYRLKIQLFQPSDGLHLFPIRYPAPVLKRLDMVCHGGLVSEAQRIFLSLPPALEHLEMNGHPIFVDGASVQSLIRLSVWDISRVEVQRLLETKPPLEIIDWCGL